jgi:hypothetical protein
MKSMVEKNKDNYSLKIYKLIALIFQPGANLKKMDIISLFTVFKFENILFKMIGKIKLNLFFLHF